MCCRLAHVKKYLQGLTSLHELTYESVKRIFQHNPMPTHMQNASECSR